MQNPENHMETIFENEGIHSPRFNLHQKFSTNFKIIKCNREGNVTYVESF